MTFLSTHTDTHPHILADKSKLDELQTLTGRGSEESSNHYKGGNELEITSARPQVWGCRSNTHHQTTDATREVLQEWLNGRGPGQTSELVNSDSYSQGCNWLAKDLREATYSLLTSIFWQGHITYVLMNLAFSVIIYHSSHSLISANPNLFLII